MKNWELRVSEEAWGLLPFSKILKRDKSKEKEIAHKEILFIFFYCDIRSPYIIRSPEERTKEIQKDIGLPESWKKDSLMDEAIKLYEKHSESIIERLYKQSIKSASDIGDYLENTKVLLEERDNHGKPVVDISKITTSLGRVPKLMADLKAAYKQVVKEQEDLENKTKGARQFNTFEDGLTI